MKKEKAITLISLVITIIILIILAGIGINLSLGENGIFRRAEEARDKYLTAEEKERQQLNELYSKLNKIDLPENTKDTKAGTRVKVPSRWATISPNYVNTEDGKVVKKMTVSSTVYAVSGGKGITVPVPEGFYYVGGDIDTGIVISDKEEDGYETTGKDMTSHEDAVKLIGNQFVWIPCSESTYRKITWGKNGDNANNWNAQWDRETPREEYDKIKKYGGFWIGRYEAGVATLNNAEGEEVSFTDSVTFANNKRLSDAVEVQTGVVSEWKCQNYDFTARQAGSTIGTGSDKVVSGNVISKANAVPYYHADYYTAVEMSGRMYEENSYVKSALVTGTQRDMMLKYMQGKGINVEGTGGIESQWGNYINTTLTGLRGAYAKVNSSGVTESFKKVPESTETNVITSESLKNNYVLLTTGSTNQVKKMNLYDVSGNLWEWTQEAAYASNISATSNSLYNIQMLRGGGMGALYTVTTACYRCWSYVPDAYTTNGFRVALCLV